MRNELLVLAECVDVRTGRRFTAGDTFEPAPSIEQAARLVASGCLPVAATKHALDSDASDKAVTAFLKTKGLTAPSKVDKIIQNVEAVRRAADDEIEKINAAVNAARASADAELAKIATEVSEAQTSAATAIAECEKAVKEAREKSAADVDLAKSEVAASEATRAAKEKSQK